MWRRFLFVAFALFSFAHSSTIRAQNPSNTALGYNAFTDNTSGIKDTAIGAAALNANTTGYSNTAIGNSALQLNTNGHSNTAIGVNALKSNSSNAYNTASGFEALLNATADDNTATGALSLRFTTTGFYNTATGVSALYFNTTGYYNVASGVSALTYNVAGHDNTAEGFQALLNNKGSNNIGVGSNAGANLTTGSNNIDIGNLGVAGDASKIRIGKSTHTATYIGGIYNKTVASGTKVAVMIDSTGKLGTVVSSARFKEAIKPMDKASEAVLKLEPVTFRYKQELDPDGIRQFGLVAEEVEKVNPDLVAHDEEGKADTVRYEAVNAMLLNEFLKEHRQVQELKGTVARQQKQIEALTAGLQKVTGQLETGTPAPRIAIRN